MNDLKEEPLRKELLSHRGRLSKYMVRDGGKICKFNLSLVIVVHFAFAIGFFLVSFQFI